MTQGRPSLARIASVLLLAMALSTFPFYSLGALAPVISGEMDLTPSQLAFLGTVMFLVAALSSPLLGAVTDRLGGRTVIVAMFLVVALTLLVMGLAGNYVTLAAGLALGGVGVAAAGPATNQVAMVQVPYQRRGLIVGLKQSGGQLAPILAGALPMIAVLVGWRHALLAAAALAGLSAAWAGDVTPVPRAAHRPHPDERRLDRTSTRAVKVLGVYAFVMSAGAGGVGLYLPLYAYTSLDLSQALAGFTLMIVGIAGFVGRMLWSAGAQVSATARAPLVPVALLAAVSLLCVWRAEHGMTWLVWIGAALYGLSGSTQSSVQTVVLLREVRTEAVGRASGAVRSSAFLAQMISPLLLGLYAERANSLGVIWPVLSLLFVIGAGIAVAWLVAGIRPTTKRS